MTALDRFVGALEAGGHVVKSTNGGFLTTCPAHEDGSPSLAFKQGDKGVVLTCHAGCARTAVVEAVGLKMADLFDAPMASTRPAAPARPARREWAIRDVAGNVIATHVRDDFPDGHKTYKWRRGNVWSLGGLSSEDLPLYRSETLAKATGPVVVTEGEKAADAVARRGFAVVGTVTGAHACPGAEALAVLAGRDVILWPDADVIGRGHMAAIAASLRGVATSIRCVEWTEAPPKGDAADYPGNDEAFRALVTGAKPWAALPPAVPARKTEGHGSGPEAARDADGRIEVLIPAAHVFEDDRTDDVGTDRFVAGVLDALPPGTIYKRGEAVGRIVGPKGRARFEILSPVTMRTVIDEHIRLVWWTVRGRGQERGVAKTYQPCSQDLAALVLGAAASSTQVRELLLLVSHPVYLPSWDLARPGWNEPGGVYFDEPAELVDIAPGPGGDAALDVLDDLVRDWPFKDEAARQNAYALALTLVARPAILGPTPFFLACASLERTGKGKLLDCLALATVGERTKTLVVGNRDEEIEKRVTSLLRRAEKVVHFDNLAGGEEVDSPALASLATSWPHRSSRLLGGHEAPALPNGMVVTMSANNPRATGEIGKRVVPIVLESRTPHPELRQDFVHMDPYAYATLRRPAVLGAILGMVDAWKAAGCPAGSIPFGGFEAWASDVGGILATAGAVAFLTNRKTWAATSDDFTADAEHLVDVWAERFGLTPQNAATLLPLAMTNGLFGHLLNRPTPDGNRAVFGRRVLQHLKDRPVGKWIVRWSGSGSSSLYSLVPTFEVDPQTTPDSPDSPGLGVL